MNKYKTDGHMRYWENKVGWGEYGMWGPGVDILYKMVREVPH